MYFKLKTLCCYLKIIQSVILELVPPAFSSLALDKPLLLTHGSVAHRNPLVGSEALSIDPFPSVIAKKKILCLTY